MLDAQATLDGAPDAAVQSRLDSVKAFVHYLRLEEEHLEAEAAYNANPNPSTQAAFEDQTRDMLRFIWGTYARNMIHTYRLHQKLILDMPSGSPIIGEWSLTNPSASGWATVTTVTGTQLHQYMADGSAAYPGISNITRRVFGPNESYQDSFLAGNLVPLIPGPGDTTPITTFHWIVGASDGGDKRMMRYVAHKAGVGAITLTLQLFETTGGNVPVRVRVYSPSGALADVVGCSDLVVNQWRDNTVMLSGPAGNYTLEVCLNSLSIQWRWRVARNIPFVVHPRFTRAGTSGFNATIPWYFYVPRGETRILLAYNTNGPGIRFFDGSGVERTVTKTGMYQYTCDVPTGQDGKVWYLLGARDATNAVEPYFENCPRTMAWSREQMMVPAELLS